MTWARHSELMLDDASSLTQDEINAGWHYCSEMDGLLANSNESDGDCFCDLNKLRKSQDVPLDIS